MKMSIVKNFITHVTSHVLDRNKQNIDESEKGTMKDDDEDGCWMMMIALMSSLIA